MNQGNFFTELKRRNVYATEMKRRYFFSELKLRDIVAESAYEL
jgi:hypothetical protein